MCSSSEMMDLGELKALLKWSCLLVVAQEPEVQRGPVTVCISHTVTSKARTSTGPLAWSVLSTIPHCSVWVVLPVICGGGVIQLSVSSEFFLFSFSSSFFNHRPTQMSQSCLTMLTVTFKLFSLWRLPVIIASPFSIVLTLRLSMCV